MKRNTSVVIGATFVLPLLTAGTGHAAPTSDGAASPPPAAATRLTEAELDTVTAGAASVLPVLPSHYPVWEPIGQPPIATTLAIGEEGGYCPYPIVLEPIAEPPLLTTMAVGEEGGGYGSIL